MDKSQASESRRRFQHLESLLPTQCQGLGTWPKRLRSLPSWNALVAGGQEKETSQQIKRGILQRDELCDAKKMKKYKVTIRE